MDLIYLYQTYYICKKGNYYIKVSFFFLFEHLSVWNWQCIFIWHLWQSVLKMTFVLLFLTLHFSLVMFLFSLSHLKNKNTFASHFKNRNERTKNILITHHIKSFAAKHSKSKRRRGLSEETWSDGVTLSLFYKRAHLVMATAIIVRGVAQV